MGQRRSWQKTILLKARGLACGVTVAAASMAGYIWLSVPGPGSWFISKQDFIQIMAVATAFWGAVLFVLTAPVWWLLTHWRLAGWPAAALLGFVAPMAWGFITDSRVTPTPLGTAADTLPFALSGVLAAVAAWLTGPKIEA